MSQLAQRLFMASGGKKSSTYVDDVFSTYLYKGTGGTQAIENGIKLGNSNVGGSVEFQESNLDKLSFASTSDFTFGTGDFTIECFVNYNAISNDGIFSLSSTAGGITTGSALSLNVLSSDGGKYAVYFKNTQNGTSSPGTCSNVAVNVGQWYHLAMVRQSGQSKFFVNGVAQTFGSDCTNDITITDTTNYTWTNLGLGGYYDNTFLLNGRISNFRITKGQALYWSNFTAPTQALTTTSQGATASNVKLLCCNKGTVTGKTVGPTITSSGSPTASGFGPFTGSGGEGGMVWAKDRSDGQDHQIVDTVRGDDKYIFPNMTNAESTVEGNGSTVGRVNSFNNNGFTLQPTQYDGTWNKDGDDYASWTFRESKEFFNIKTWDGNNTAGRQLAHNLGCVPGMVIVKETTGTQSWTIYHRGNPNPPSNKIMFSTSAVSTTSSWNDVVPTSSYVELGGNSAVNGSGKSYVGYFFAGGESTAATAKSVDFDGSDDYLSIPDNAAWDIGSSDATIECWVKFDTHNGHDGIIHQLRNGLPNASSSWAVEPVSGILNFYYAHSGTSYGNVSGAYIPLGQWQHIAITKSGTTIKIYQDGIQTGSGTLAGTINNGTVPLDIGGNCVGQWCDCKISNVRITKGQVLYTSFFKPTYEPLTTTSQGASSSNVVLLCCNDSSPTGSTVTPDTITNNNGSTASTDSPFDDPEGFKFGEGGDQNIIKCGSYTGNTSYKPEIYLGWEPQWILVKNTNLSTEQWFIFDSMRGIITNGTDYVLEPSRSVAEAGWDLIDLTPTGFKIKMNDDKVNNNGGNYIYTAIRRPDGYVGKPAEAGNDVFAMDVGTTSAGIPNFDSGFPVDYAHVKQFAGVANTHSLSRLTGDTYVNTNQIRNIQNYSAFQWDSNEGWYDGGYHSTGFQSWMWKRHAGFDVVTYTGNSVQGRDVPHNLGVAPNMMWVKNRTRTTGGGANWIVYVSGITYLSVFGSDPDNYGNNPVALELNDTEYAQFSASGYWDHTHPTSTHFRVGDTYHCNQNGESMIAMLFASIDGISKVGSYTGATAGVTVTTGFQPRFLILKNVKQASNWTVLDTRRGWGSGNDERLYLNTDVAQSASNVGAPTSTGFTITNNWDTQGDTIIYYAHA